MTQKARISKLEASLTAKQKLYSWLKHAKLSGGLIPYLEKELTGPMLPLEWLTDEEARFLWYLVIDANIEILRCMHANDELWGVVHLALMLGYLDEAIKAKILRSNHQLRDSGVACTHTT